MRTTAPTSRPWPRHSCGFRFGVTDWGDWQDINPPMVHGLGSACWRRCMTSANSIWDTAGRPLTSCIVERDVRTRDAVRADVERAVEAEQRAVDLAVLRAIRGSHITSQSMLRSCVGLQRDVVNAVSRGCCTLGMPRRQFNASPDQT